MTSNRLFTDLLEEIDRAIKNEATQVNTKLTESTVIEDTQNNNHNKQTHTVQTNQWQTNEYNNVNTGSENIFNKKENTPNYDQDNFTKDISKNNITQEKPNFSTTKTSSDYNMVNNHYKQDDFLNIGQTNKNHSNSHEEFSDDFLKEKGISNKINSMSNNAAYSEENAVLKNIMGKVIRQWLSNEGKVIIEEFFKVHIARVLEKPDVLMGLFGRDFTEKLPEKIVENYLNKPQLVSYINSKLDNFLGKEILNILKPVLSEKIDTLIQSFNKFIQQK